MPCTDPHGGELRPLAAAACAPASEVAAVLQPLAGKTANDRRWLLGRTAGLGLSGLAGLAGLAALGGCATRKPAPPPPPRAPMPSAVPPPPVAQRPLPPPAAAPAPPPPITREARNWTEYRTLAARRLVQANPDMTYMGTPPEPLLAIPILEIELYVDGSIQNIRVQRQPRQAVDTVQLAINAVRRAAPFPPVGHLPRPWRFTEVFLFDDQRRFKPRTLDV